MGFSLFLILCCMAGGVLWASWKIQMRNVSTLAQVEDPVWVDMGRTVFLIFLFLLIVRSFIVEPYRIPSESMMPTLLSGDFIFVKKYSYALTLPLANVLLVKTGTPKRGDVVAFRKPGEQGVHYIKRVVGLPGDRLSYKNRQLSINGYPVPLIHIDNQEQIEMANYDQAIERLDDVEHPVLHHRVESEGTIKWFEKTVPEGHYFMMGDNRDDSQDSRDPQVGVVPHENLVGRATRVWMNVQELDRIGKVIQ